MRPPEHVVPALLLGLCLGGSAVGLAASVLGAHPFVVMLGAGFGMVGLVALTFVLVEALLAHAGRRIERARARREAKRP